jgi:hypothetical protein
MTALGSTGIVSFAHAPTRPDAHQFVAPYSIFVITLHSGVLANALGPFLLFFILFGLLFFGLPAACIVVRVI